MPLRRPEWCPALCKCGSRVKMRPYHTGAHCGMPVPGGHLYLNDIVICTAAILLDPLGAVCGIMICFPCRLANIWDHWLQSGSV